MIAEKDKERKGAEQGQLHSGTQGPVVQDLTKAIYEQPVEWWMHDEHHCAGDHLWHIMNGCQACSCTRGQVQGLIVKGSGQDFWVRTSGLGVQEFRVRVRVKGPGSGVQGQGQGCRVRCSG